MKTQTIIPQPELYLSIVRSEFHSFLIVGGLDLELARHSFGVSPVDFQVISAETIKIEQIRELIHWLFLRPMNSQQKVAVIDNAETMTTEAANALLKTLEEPPDYARIILVTPYEQKILATIQSRCRKVRLPLIESSDLPENYFSAAEIKEKTIKDRFELVAKYVELSSKDLNLILTCWQSEFRERLLSGENCLAILKQLTRAKDLLETNISVKLLLENIVIKM